ncbi:helix-turn-helix domain-containing protein [Rhizobium sp. VS19-DR104.2]|uniref:helix-turn-helix domain-containing protein n=1 Tax=unclassified Rhizobium TaxID=2613769 RepID=UPI001C5BE142|nr:MULTISPECIES: helix-turn-helix transcriptional regulator [unclassified Rhizobium]MBZ5763761.1 helix-turn-helix domain-containing protein [Rhizobium sp. VS19-DR96]MBZ5769697.1 helix-turn-helix domain-containing protein [Rhizobium sp. VS19-DR129.2]MBZ5777038.1 helix-turn-helix domain-containing protein [Rhizobium sp. VS19-DRK62.2]MBZ5788107.1 helix-turn-helix domain-containing protein [Rhizobium sp. VS19-DR121]MBZ5805816.1 helix-turn-helix domain-containing protein [Rhizobium sp. VS19-DR181]
MDEFPTFKQEMGKRLSKVRSDAGLSQNDFAAILKVSEKLYAAYEAGEREIPIEVLLALHDQNVDVSWVMSGEEPRWCAPTAANAPSDVARI